MTAVSVIMNVISEKIKKKRCMFYETKQQQFLECTKKYVFYYIEWIQYEQGSTKTQRMASSLKLEDRCYQSCNFCIRAL